MTQPRKVRLLFIVFVTALGFAFGMPGIAAGGQEGLAATGTAAITFLAGMTVAAVVAIGLFVVTLRARATFPATSRILGMTPLPICAILLAVVVALLVSARPKTNASPPPPSATTTPPPPPTSP